MFGLAWYWIVAIVVAAIIAYLYFTKSPLYFDTVTSDITITPKTA